MDKMPFTVLFCYYMMFVLDVHAAHKSEAYFPMIATYVHTNDTAGLQLFRPIPKNGTQTVASWTDTSTDSMIAKVISPTEMMHFWFAPTQQDQQEKQTIGFWNWHKDTHRTITLNVSSSTYILHHDCDHNSLTGTLVCIAARRAPLTSFPAAIRAKPSKDKQGASDASVEVTSVIEFDATGEVISLWSTRALIKIADKDELPRVIEHPASKQRWNDSQLYTWIACSSIFWDAKNDHITLGSLSGHTITYDKKTGTVVEFKKLPYGGHSLKLAASYNRWAWLINKATSQKPAAAPTTGSANTKRDKSKIQTLEDEEASPEGSSSPSSGQKKQNKKNTKKAARRTESKTNSTAGVEKQKRLRSAAKTCVGISNGLSSSARLVCPFSRPANNYFGSATFIPPFDLLLVASPRHRTVMLLDVKRRKQQPTKAGKGEGSLPDSNPIFAFEKVWSAKFPSLPLPKMKQGSSTTFAEAIYDGPVVWVARNLKVTTQFLWANETALVHEAVGQLAVWSTVKEPATSMGRLVVTKKSQTSTLTTAQDDEIVLDRRVVFEAHWAPSFVVLPKQLCGAFTVSLSDDWGHTTHRNFLSTNGICTTVLLEQGWNENRANSNKKKKKEKEKSSSP
eukprot:TRINITY_DN57798_c0_g1_i1.p1 TRINITY_DN57798_c0_g1~~TRINITY_DN57798_c0_g1_i1.p1  ORF type:complete len:621 (+),score=49.01 TRINITY_DN57798_c0_g1_i1:59-1921(+)